MAGTWIISKVLTRFSVVVFLFLDGITCTLQTLVTVKRLLSQIDCSRMSLKFSKLLILENYCLNYQSVTKHPQIDDVC